MRGDERIRKIFELLAVSLELRNEGIRAVCFWLREVIERAQPPAAGPVKGFLLPTHGRAAGQLWKRGRAEGRARLRAWVAAAGVGRHKSRTYTSRKINHLQVGAPQRPVDPCLTW
jgi:hypothetical protein